MLNNPIPNAAVEIYNVTDDLIASGITDEKALLSWILVTERIQDYSINITNTPHNISAIKDSYIGFVDPEPVMDTSKTVNITLMIPPPLHHINIVPTGPEIYNIDDTTIYTATGWNDAGETLLNTTWTPVWSVNNTSIASIDSSTGDFTAIAFGSGIVNVTDSSSPGIFNASYFTIEPRPLHHIDIIPDEPRRCYIGDEFIYTAIGWNDQNESYQNTSWTPQWTLDNPSIASIDQITGEFKALASGSGEINISAVGFPEIYKTIQFTIEPWPLHHIEISPSGPANYYIGDTQTYTAIGWNDAQETQMNISWSPVWSVEDTSIASIDSASGELTTLALGSSNIQISAASLPLISNSSSFSVDPWPLHHIEIIPGSSGNYYIGDTNTYTVIGWNDESETQMNTSWTPVWSIENTSLASINGSGSFTTTALGNSVVNVSSSSNPLIFSTVPFTIHPWPLHHISIEPLGPETYKIGDIVIYSVIGWNDAQETQINTSWVPIWTLEGDIQEVTFDGQEATFEAKKAGEGSIKCSDEGSNIYVISEIKVIKKDTDGDPGWIWILIIIVIIILLLFILFYWKKNQKNEGKEAR